MMCSCRLFYLYPIRGRILNEVPLAGVKQGSLAQSLGYASKGAA